MFHGGARWYDEVCIMIEKYHKYNESENNYIEVSS